MDRAKPVPERRSAIERDAEAAAESLVGIARAAGLTIAVAESCTAGLVADLLARTPGASRVFWGSFVCYTVNAKHRMLGLDRDLVERFGAVSRETALSMARSLAERSGADLAVSVTGLAGPEGDGSASPVGTVWIGRSIRGGEPAAAVYHYGGSRSHVRLAAAREAIGILKALAGDLSGEASVPDTCRNPDTERA
ncbi:MAG: nicotinamide-nucleotide amidohydrolase family protein [Spirochaetaceae bacterium]|jgi:PncC family amidohydrolase|nr:nicotinamide-nucleotide amidohydrolase family protein [Spirochaetaceae bacterium]